MPRLVIWLVFCGAWALAGIIGVVLGSARTSERGLQVKGLGSDAPPSDVFWFYY